MPKPTTRYVLDYVVTVVKENNMGICVGTSRILSSNCEVSKEEASKFSEFVISNEMTELKKAKVRIINE